MNEAPLSPFAIYVYVGLISTKGKSFIIQQ